MKIQTNEEPIIWRNKNYQIDHGNGLAFPPHTIRQAMVSYQMLLERGKIRPETISVKRQSFLKRFIGQFS